MIAKSYQIRAMRKDRRVSLPRTGFWLLVFSYLAFCVSDMMLSIQDDNSQMVKIVAFMALGLAVMLRPKFHKRILLVGLLLFVFLIAIGRSFNVAAGVDELQRFVFPIAITLAIYAYKDRINSLASIFLIVVISNDIFQCYFYLAYVTKLPLIVPVRIDSGLYLRAQGWIGFFSEFGFMNFCALVICAIKGGDAAGKLRKTFFLIFALLSFSFKLFVIILFYPIVFRKTGWKASVAPLMIAVIVLAVFISGYLDDIVGLASSKVAFYITAGNSARAESYRVMWESLSGGNFLGEGLGAFGGPASVKFNSPLYSKYHFDWYGMGGILKTTDTFYPHLFVELGLLGGAIWLYLVIMYGQRDVMSRAWIFVTCAFLFDNLFSLAILSPSYVFSAFLVLYVISQSRPTEKDGCSLDGRYRDKDIGCYKYVSWEKSKKFHTGNIHRGASRINQEDKKLPS
ncbi:hypothetical protein [Paraburkholderia tagetis]|uniref:Uncharacterized protein n=1 Tax=Paraburkholderia tagetis TaxID=2913261 RepID=A0A9X1RN39_9BURK|nr:hypothetical protein [Paraburkholderia tagetis]MCG5072831.1 hypothetical protein [Paraburkholderia tagetis]